VSPLKMERTVFKVGEDSFAITLPKSWISYRQLKHGDVVEIIVDDDLIIRPKKEESEVKS